MDMQTELSNFLGEKRNLVDAITREFRAGTSAAAIAREVTSAFGRDTVTQYLAAVERCDLAREALQGAALDGFVSAAVTGIEPPRQATICLTVDPAEVADIEGIPAEIRSALAPFHLGLELIAEDDQVVSGTDPESVDHAVDRTLLDGDSVQIVRMRPIGHARRRAAQALNIPIPAADQP